MIQSATTSIDGFDSNYQGGAMHGSADENVLHKAMQVLWFLWGGMFVSLLIYTGLVVFAGHLLRSGKAQLDPATLQTLTMALAFIAAVLLAGAFIVRNRLLNASPAAATRPARRGNDDGPPPPPAVARYTTAMLVSLALCEAVAIFGFVLFMLGADNLLCYLFIGTGAMAMLFFRPRREGLLRVEKLLSGNDAII